MTAFGATPPAVVQGSVSTWNDVQTSIDTHVAELRKLLLNTICRERVRRARGSGGELSREKEWVQDVLFVAEPTGPLGLKALRLTPDHSDAAPHGGEPPFPEPFLWLALIAAPLRSSLAITAHEPVDRAASARRLITFTSSYPTGDLRRHTAWSGELIWDLDKSQVVSLTASPNLEKETIRARRLRYATAFRFSFFGLTLTKAKKPLLHTLTIDYGLAYEDRVWPRRAEMRTEMRTGPNETDLAPIEVTVVEYAECHRFTTETTEQVLPQK